jgi:lipopolysaccharide/colanic/teichoic acid biosynthesis glycosyltransferase
MQRVFDFVISFIAIIALMPFMVPVMVVLLVTGEHRVFYLQRRIGRGGKAFSVFKFATMLKDSPSLKGGYITQKDDSRVLPVGRFLRKAKINELPQLINIFLGQMSFVGPRPLVESHLGLYLPEDRAAVLGLRPGLTGLASLIFRDEEEILNKMPGDRKANHDSVIGPYKGRLESWYSMRRSILLYFKIISSRRSL